jgi:predicted transcriptional regulator
LDTGTITQAEYDEGVVAEKVDLIDMTADIVAAYVGHNPVAPDELSDLINRVFSARASRKSPPFRFASRSRRTI